MSVKLKLTTVHAVSKMLKILTESWKYKNLDNYFAAQLCDDWLLSCMGIEFPTSLQVLLQFAMCLQLSTVPLCDSVWQKSL